MALVSPAHTETYCGRLCQDLEERLEDYSGTNPYGLELLFPHELPEGASKYDWDARNNNVIYVIVNNGPFTPDDPPLNKHVFDMHFFEDIHVPVNGPERYGLIDRKVNDELFSGVRLEDGGIQLHASQVETINYETTLTLTIADRSIIVQGDILNRGDFDWPCFSSFALFCFRARNNRDFMELDSSGEVVQFPAGINTFVADYENPDDYYSIAEMDGFQWPYFGIGNNDIGDGCGLTNPRYKSCLWKTNQGDTIRMYGDVEPTYSFTGNRALNLNCIHPNISLPVNAGETMGFYAVLDIREGDHFAETVTEARYFEFY